MDVEALPDAASFLAVTEELRTREPILTNLLASIAEGVLAGRRYESELWLVARNSGAVVGAVVRTAPFKATLSPMPARAALAVGRWLRAEGVSLPGLTGPVDVVQAVADGLGSSVQVTLSEVVRVLTELSPPRTDRRPPGHPARASRVDLDLLVRWLQAFEVEVGLQRYASHEQTGAQIDSGRLRVWRVDDKPVSVAGHAPVVTTLGGVIGRVGPVYTPPEHRRRGYGAAVTRAITSELIEQCDRVMLFADAANSDSNSIYEAMGFAVVAKVVEAELHE